jgi:hypothetical protein
MKNELRIVPALTAANFAQALGIGTQREEQLCDLIGKCYDDTDTYPLAIECISENVNNINELAYALFHLGAYAGSEQQRRMMMKRLEE